MRPPTKNTQKYRFWNILFHFLSYIYKKLILNIFMTIKKYKSIYNQHFLCKYIKKICNPYTHRSVICIYDNFNIDLAHNLNLEHLWRHNVTVVITNYCIEYGKSVNSLILYISNDHQLHELCGRSFAPQKKFNSNSMWRQKKHEFRIYFMGFYKSISSVIIIFFDIDISPLNEESWWLFRS